MSTENKSFNIEKIQSQIYFLEDKVHNFVNNKNIDNNYIILDSNRLNINKELELMKLQLNEMDTDNIKREIKFEVDVLKKNCDMLNDKNYLLSEEIESLKTQ